jgi:hypothetical protein
MSRQIAAQTQNQLNNRLDGGLLLGRQAYRTSDNFEAGSS